VDEFVPDIIHSHHPFLMGDAAIRTARKRNIPIVFTHHTLYERYTHYTPVDSSAMKRFAVELPTQYANLCDHIIAPSESIMALLIERGVEKPITVIPTGVDLNFFAEGNGDTFRKEYDIDPDTYVVGHVGRLALEKNLDYLTRAVALFLKKNRRAVFVVVGKGDDADRIRQICDKEKVADQLIMTGSRTGRHLADAYCAFDIFVFASKTETQGRVLTEAMAAGSPVLALDASGVREVLNDEKNGRLLEANASAEQFAQCLDKIFHDSESLKLWKAGAYQTAIDFSREKSARRLEEVYRLLRDAAKKKPPISEDEFQIWDDLLKTIDVEWNLLVEKAKAFLHSGVSESHLKGTEE
jgi:1,2-diacylglycerol 3-alpha-glucosyltransferase